MGGVGSVFRKNFGLLFFVVLATLAATYQNCSNSPSFTGQNLSSGVGNGWAYEGITFSSSTKCEDGSSRAKIKMQADGTGLLLRYQCANLEVPILIEARYIRIDKGRPGEIMFDSVIYSQESVTPPPELTPSPTPTATPAPTASPTPVPTATPETGPALDFPNQAP